MYLFGSVHLAHLCKTNRSVDIENTFMVTQEESMRVGGEQDLVHLAHLLRQEIERLELNSCSVKACGIKGCFLSILM